jgi:hypothetical protein
LVVVDVLVRQCFSFEFVSPGALEDSRIAALAAWRIGAFEDLGDRRGQAGGEPVRGKNPPVR